MLKSISLKKVASYADAPQKLDNLKSLNFIYGENGCGKSTIAQFINNHFNQIPSPQKFDHCEVCHGWRDDEKRVFYIYDADYVKNLMGESTLNGVFIMGQDAPELEKDKKLKETEIINLNAKISNEQTKISDLKTSLEEELKKFANQCWEIGEPYKDIFREAYLGSMVPRTNFMDKCLKNMANKEVPLTIESLIESAKLYFSNEGKPQEKELLVEINWSKLSSLHEYSILETPIKGKENTTVAELINKLGNNDWVDQGRSFYDGITCPFCQQATDKNLGEELESYFDRTYTTQKEKINTFVDQYHEDMAQLVSIIANYSNTKDDLFDYTKVETHLKSIEIIIQSNKNKLSQKLKEPSVVIKLDSIEHDLESIKSILIHSNEKIKEYNGKIALFDQGKKKLKDDIWHYLGHQIKSRFDEHKAVTNKIDREIQGRTASLNTHKTTVGIINKEVFDISEKLKSIAKSAKDINNILKSFGFNNFHLKEEDDQAHYSIMRDDGSKANKTLSEGEKTFLAFLYFYQMLKGVRPESGLIEDKIVIFDDPVSSLDSKVLYVISALIKELARSRDEFKIHQIFLLTHNVYFFKEVTNAQKSDIENSSYWIIRKAEKYSYFESHEKNPVRTSYQMLWEEVIKAPDYPDIDIRNTLRRILENYFKMFGGKDKWELSTPFEGSEKVVCDSLLHWTNDGSHTVFDDIFISQNDELKQLYLKVFEDIFRKNNHGSHYDMMMHNN